MQSPINKKEEKRIDNSTLSVIRANPKLSGNIKIVIDQNENLFLSTFEFIPNLSQSEKLKYPINIKENLSINIKNFIKNTYIDNDNLYTNYRKKVSNSVSNNFYDFYEDDYLAGVKYKDSLQYKEKLSAFYPIWLRKQIPSHFFIFKAKNAYSKLGNTTNFNTNNVQDWINDFYIFKTFDLSENSKIGQLLRSVTNLKNWDDMPFNFNPSGQSEYKGIDFKRGIYTGVYEDINKDLFLLDKIVLEKNDIVTRGFSRNNLICANAINLEFLFDDNEVGQINRYFGIYADFDEIQNFVIDKERAKIVANEFNENAWDSLNTSKRVSKSNMIYTNTNLVDFNDLQTNRFWTIKTAKNTFYSISNNAWGDNLDIVIKNKNINIDELVNFEVVNETINCEIVDSQFSLPSVRFDLIRVPNDGDSIRISYTDVLNPDFNDNADVHTLVATSNLNAGEYKLNTFSNKGGLSIICNAMINCLKGLNNDFGIGFELVSMGGTKLLLLSTIQSQIRNNTSVEFYTSSVLPFVEVFENYKIENASNYLLSPIISNVTTNIGVVTSVKLVGAFEDKCIKIKRSDLIAIKNVKDPYIQKTNNFEVFGVDDFDNPIICPYTSNLKKDAFGNYTDNNNIVEYMLILRNVKIPSSKKLQLFNIKLNYVGLLSLNHIVDYDIELENSIYSKLLVSDISKLSDFYLNGGINGFNTTFTYPVNNSQVLTDLYSNNTEFVLNGGFFKLSDFSLDSDVYKSEYDRLKEYYLKETSLISKTSIWINKWGSNYLNNRDVNYGLRTSNSFGATNFTPSFKEFSINAKLLTHDWLLLCGTPPYFNNTDFINAKDRVFTIPNIDDFLITDTFFKNTFEIKTVNNLEVEEYNLYSYIQKNDGLYYTMFRGVLIQTFKTATNIKIDNNIDDINTIDFDFSNYKFAAILVPTSPGVKIKIIRNDIEKSILLVCQCDIFDEISNTYTDGFNNFTFIDRSQLYTNFHKLKYDNINNEIVYDDINVSGSIQSWTISNTGLITFLGNLHLNNNTLTDFENEIYPNSNGIYETIRITTGTDILEISDIVKLTSTTIQANSFTINGLPINVSSSVLSLSLVYGYIVPALRTANYIYTNGGFNANLRVLERICFANLATLINDGNKSIEYIAKLKDQTIVNNDFYIKLVEPYSILNTTFKNPINDEKPAVLRNTNETIGFKIKNDEFIKAEVIFAYGGKFQPIFKPLTQFSLEPSNLFEKSYFRNTKLLNNQLNYLTYFNKVSTNAATRILTPTLNDFEPVYPKINEISIDKRIVNAINSSFDFKFYLESLNKNSYNNVFGAITNKINKSVLSSVVLLSSDSFDLTSFIPNFIQPFFSNEFNFETLNLNDRQELYIYEDIDINCLFDIDKCLVNRLKVEFNQVFITNFTGEVLNDIIFRFGNFDNFIDKFLLSEIIPRYEVSSIRVYKKTTSNVLTSFNQSFEFNTTEFVKQSTMSLVNVKSIFRDFNKRNFTITIPKRLFFNSIFSFAVTTNIK